MMDSPPPEHLPRLASQAYEQGDLPRAEILAQAWREAAPSAPGACILLAQVAARQRRVEDAIRHYEAAYALAPEAALAYNLGNLWRHRGDVASARSWYRQATEQNPALHPAWLAEAELALAGGAPEVAAQAALAALRARPGLDLAIQSLVNAAAMATQRDLQHGAADEPVLRPADRTTGAHWSVVVCSIDPVRLAAFRASIERSFVGENYEIIHIGDARSLCEGYNRGLARARGDVLLFCHDDIDFLEDHLPAKLLAHLEHHDLIGAAGTTRLTGPAVFWSGHPYIHGWIIQHDPRAAMPFQPCFSSLVWPHTSPAQALDGLFLACRREVAESVGWDAETFDGFHLYDLDFSYRAFRQGYKLGICNDLGIVHASRGNFDARWEDHARRFIAKFPELSGPRGPLSHYYACRLENQAQALACQRRLVAWLAGDFGQVCGPSC